MSLQRAPSRYSGAQHSLSYRRPLISISHGYPRTHAASAMGVQAADSNLGQLSKFAGVGQVSPADAQAMLTRVDPSRRNFRICRASILILLAFTFNRILGLDQILIKAARTATARREQEERDAMRKRLVQMLDGGADSGAGRANGVPKPPPRGNGPSNMH